VLNGAAQPLSITGYAMCLLDGPNQPQVVHVYTQPAPGTSGSAYAQCPGGTSLIGGGMEGEYEGSRVTESRPDGNGWRAVMYDDDVTNRYVDAFAVCLSGVTSTSVSANVGVVAGADNIASAACAGGTTVTAGGYAYTLTQDGLTKVWLSRADGNGWMADAKNNSSHLFFLTVYAVCVTF
jgi:hypothetical protein